MAAAFVTAVMTQGILQRLVDLLGAGQGNLVFGRSDGSYQSVRETLADRLSLSSGRSYHIMVIRGVAVIVAVMIQRWRHGRMTLVPVDTAHAEIHTIVERVIFWRKKLFFVHVNQSQGA